MDIKTPTISSIFCERKYTSPREWIRRCIGSWEILLVISGDFEIVYKSKKIKLIAEEPQILIYKPGYAYHFCYTSAKYINVRMRLREELKQIIQLKEIIDGMSCLTLSHALFRRTERDLMEAVEAERLQLPNWECLATALAETVILRVTGSASVSETASPELAKAYDMLSNFEDINMKTIAEKCGLSVQVFYKKFKQESGRTPRSFHEQFKLEEAKRLLSETNMTLSEIALQVNMYDQYYLSKRFKKYLGLSPSEFRKETVKERQT